MLKSTPTYALDIGHVTSTVYSLNYRQLTNQHMFNYSHPNFQYIYLLIYFMYYGLSYFTLNSITMIQSSPSRDAEYIAVPSVRNDIESH